MNETTKKRRVYLKLGAVFLLAVAVLGGVVVTRSQMASGRGALPVAEYREAPRNFAGNRYALDARVEELLGYRESVGRVFLVRETDSGDPLALFVDPEFEDFSPSPGQVFRFEISVAGDGLLGMDGFRKL